MGTRRRDLVTIERTVQALDLRRLGRTYSEIAQATGLSVSGAYRSVKRAIAEKRADAGELASEIIELECDRLDRMFAGSYQAACEGDPTAVACCVKLMERRAKLLGLDRAQVAQVDVAFRRGLEDYTDDELQAIIDGARREETADGESHE